MCWRFQDSALGAAEPSDSVEDQSLVGGRVGQPHVHVRPRPPLKMKQSEINRPKWVGNPLYLHIEQ